MAREPIVSGPQGVPFSERWDALYPPPDPNNPQYDLHNTYQRVPPGTRTNPPPWGVGGIITRGEPMLNTPTADPMTALFSQHPQQLQRMAGDVVPGPAAWYGANQPDNPMQSMGASGMWNLSKKNPYAVDTLGISVTPDARQLLEALAGRKR